MGILESKVYDVLNNIEGLSSELKKLKKKTDESKVRVQQLADNLGIELKKCMVCRGRGSYEQWGGYGGMELLTVECDVCDTYGYVIDKKGKDTNLDEIHALLKEIKELKKDILELRGRIGVEQGYITNIENALGVVIGKCNKWNECNKDTCKKDCILGYKIESR